MHTARGYSLGAVDYILSPVVPNILRSKVKALVQLHRLNAELKKRSDERVALVKEQAARTMAEESQRRASFLAEATQVMASSLDIDTILNGASVLVVPFLADYGAVVMVNEDGSIRARRNSCVAGWEQYLGGHAAAFEALLGEQQAHAIEARTSPSPTTSRDAPRARSTTACSTRRSRTRTGARTSSSPRSRTSCATRWRRCAPRCTCCARSPSSASAPSPCCRPWTARSRR